MREPDLDALWLLLDTDDPRLPLVTEGEARAVVVLLRIMGEGGGEAADLARHVAASLARRLPAED